MAALAPDYAQVETFVIEMTNAYRRENKLGTVRINPKLSAAARKYAALLAKTQEFSHTAGGTNAGDRIKASGYEFCGYGENLAMAADSRGFASRPLAASAVTGWINSPGHRANMVAPNVTEIGVGVALVPYKYPKYVTVQLFGQPLTDTVEFQISNTLKEAVTYTFAGKKHKIDPSYAITHTSCTAGDITFEAGGGLFTNATTSRQAVKTGQVYVLKPDGSGGLKVDIAPRRKVE